MTNRQQAKSSARLGLHLVGLTLLLAMHFTSAAAEALRCPRIFRPVCGVVISTRTITTYANSCVAKGAGAKFLHDGKCMGPGEARCPHESPLDPVCARNDAGEKTYDNLCWAEKDWAVFIHKGPC
jgi:hypothetical protein